MNLWKRDIRYKIKFSGIALDELHKYISYMGDVYGLGIKIKEYTGTRRITLYSWEIDCLEDVFEIVLNDPNKYPDKQSEGYKALDNLYEKIVSSQRNFRF